MSIGTISTLEVLLHYHVNPMPYPHIRTPSVASEVERLVRDGMLVKNSIDGRAGTLGGETMVYSTTPKADVYIDYIKKLPFPRIKYVMGGEENDSN